VTTQSLSIALTGQDTGADTALERFVRLENWAWKMEAQYANYYDLYQMLTGARGGVSAWTYVPADCPISVQDGVVTVALPFYSYPSSFDFSYSVSTSIGTLGEPTRISEAREFDLVLDHATRIVLPYAVEAPSLEWQSPAFDRDWRVTDQPTITVEGNNSLRLSHACWGVVRLKCLAQGYLHTVQIRLVKQTTEEDENGDLNTTGYKIENLACSATAAWQSLPDEAGNTELETEVLEVEVPRCVEDYLATCEDGLPVMDVIGPDGKSKTVVYYSTCTGNIIHTTHNA
jgi:hypothetical protein